MWDTMPLQLVKVMPSGCAESAVQGELSILAMLLPKLKLKLKLRGFRFAPCRNAATVLYSYYVVDDKTMPSCPPAIDSVVLQHRPTGDEKSMA